MKVAWIPNSQQSVMASNIAPNNAICPRCSGVVILRQRKCMNGDSTYFWRHQDNRNRSCNGRSRPAQ